MQTHPGFPCHIRVLRGLPLILPFRTLCVISLPIRTRVGRSSLSTRVGPSSTVSSSDSSSSTGVGSSTNSPCLHTGWVSLWGRPRPPHPVDSGDSPTSSPRSTTGRTSTSGSILQDSCQGTNGFAIGFIPGALSWPLLVITATRLGGNSAHLATVPATIRTLDHLSYDPVGSFPQAIMPTVPHSFDLLDFDPFHFSPRGRTSVPAFVLESLTGRVANRDMASATTKSFLHGQVKF